MRSQLLFLASLWASALVGCGGGGVPSTPDSGFVAGDAGFDGSAPDASAAPDSSGAAEDAGPNCDPAGASASSCQACCASGFPAGSQIFDKYTLQCACAGEFCGPLEAGVLDAAGADSGDASATDAGSSDEDAAAADAAARRDLGPEQIPLLPVGDHWLGRTLRAEAPAVVADHVPTSRSVPVPSYACLGTEVKG